VTEVLRDELSASWPREVTCTGCNAGLRIDLDDLEFGRWKVNGYHFDGSAVCEGKYTFRCPVCGRQANGNEVSAEEIPYNHRVRIVVAAIEKHERDGYGRYGRLNTAGSGL